MKVDSAAKRRNAIGPRSRAAKRARPSRAYALWRAAWRSNSTPWVNAEADKPLLDYLEHNAEIGPGDKVLVPLCGNSAVVKALHDLGYDVSGVEYVAEAVTSLKRNFKVKHWKRTRGKWGPKYSAPRVQILQQDFFCFHDPKKYSLIYDRAAFVAINPRHRKRYARILCDSLEPGGILYLVVFRTIGKEPKGPPFGITNAEVRALFSNLRTVEKFSARYDPREARFRDAGVKAFVYTAFVLRRPSSPGKPRP